MCGFIVYIPVVLYRIRAMSLLSPKSPRVSDFAVMRKRT